MRFLIRFAIAVGCWLLGAFAGSAWLERIEWTFWIVVFSCPFALLFLILPFVFSGPGFPLWRAYIAIPVGSVVGLLAGLTLTQGKWDMLLLGPALITFTVSFALASVARASLET